jgi:hypothetical protein
MAKPFYLIWQEGTTVLEGYDGANWIDGQLTFPIVFPGVTTTLLALSLSSSASVNLTFETLINVAFYLTGSDAPTVQGEWPYITDAYGNATASVTGGVEISFDNGLTWNRFSNTVGLESTPSTWLPLPQEAVGSVGTAGQIGAFDTAHMLVRYVIPPSVSLTKVLDVQLQVDCDVV